MLPENLSYTKEHEWLKIEENTAVIGITEYAQEELGDITFVELPEIGAEFSAGDSPAVIESVKAVGSVYTPAAGTITEVNKKLDDEPELINSDPYGEGWVFKIEFTEPLGTNLMNKAEYSKYLEELD